jgi:hypothetical protein
MGKGSKKPSSKNIRASLPKTLFRLNLEALRPGDIIASTAPSSTISQAIRYWTKGPFSHVALYLSHSRLIEATGAGIFIRYPYLFVVENLANVGVFRPKPEIVDFNKNTEAYNSMQVAASRFIWGKYGTAKALAVAVPFLRLLSQQKKYFCSELVAQIYLECGISLFPDQPPALTSPKHIYQSNALKEITNQVFTEEDRDQIFGLHEGQLKTVEGTSLLNRPTLIEVIAKTIQEEADKAGRSVAEREMSGDNLRIQNDFQQTVLSLRDQNLSSRKKKAADLVRKIGGQNALAYYEEQLEKAIQELSYKLAFRDAGKQGRFPIELSYLEQAERAVFLQNYWVAQHTADIGFLKEAIVNFESEQKKDGNE